MNTHDQSAHEMPRNASGDRASRRAKWVFGGFAAFALVLLVVEHRTHLLTWLPPWWPWLFLLACPLMHVFMHRGHGSQSGKVDNE